VRYSLEEEMKSGSQLINPIIRSILLIFMFCVNLFVISAGREFVQMGTIPNWAFILALLVTGGIFGLIYVTKPTDTIRGYIVDPE